MRHSRTAISVCLALAGLSLGSIANAAPGTPPSTDGPSDSGRILINHVSGGDRVTYAMDPANGSLVTKVADGEDAVFSPNGAWVAYSHDADPCTGWPICSPTPDLWTSTASGTRKTLIVEAPQGETAEARADRPDWSPGGQRILFRWPGGTSWVRPDGSGLEHLPSVGVNATFSPDGTKIASTFGMTRPAPDEDDSGVEVRITEVGTMETQVLAVDWAGSGTGLDWSPDSGGQIVYGGDEGLRIIDVTSGEHRDLISDASVTTVRTPVYSPDGTQIAFSGYDWETDSHHIYVVNADGTGLHAIADRGGSLSDWVDFPGR